MWALVASSAHANPFTNLAYSQTAAMSELPRYTKLPLFDPHRKTFTCVYQALHLPPIDPQAEQWFQQALALDDPNVYYKDKDWAKIYQLYVKAAERSHWKAMLNLASLVLSGYPGVPERDPEIAIRWVEKAMQQGVPDAWDRMGTYHQTGLVSGGNATSAYAFFQRAADMGSPVAMTFLGDKLGGTYDDPGGEFWGNVEIATQMLECALGQGYGEAAYELGFIYKRPNTVEAKLRALRIFHEGVKLGSANCADKLSVEFDGMYLTNGTGLVTYIDKSRSERYSTVGDALKLYDGRLKLPNLDKVLPLPPAPLPKWDGNKKLLIDAAKAVTLPTTASPRPQLQGREFIPEGHGVRALHESPGRVQGHKPAPESGYWLAIYADGEKRFYARRGNPEYYQAGERFAPPSAEWLQPEEIQWHFLGLATKLPPQSHEFLAHMSAAGWMREFSERPLALACTGHQRCPEAGIWEGRIAQDHPLAAIYNRWDQQSFVEQGQSFPDPRGRYLDIAPDSVRWTWLGNPNADGDGPGIRKIAL